MTKEPIRAWGGRVYTGISKNYLLQARQAELEDFKLREKILAVPGVTEVMGEFIVPPHAHQVVMRILGMKDKDQ